MPDAPKIYPISHQELAEILIKQNNLHEGFWGIYVEFGIGASNVGQGPNESITGCNRSNYKTWAPEISRAE